MTQYFIINGRVIDPSRKLDAKLNLHISDGKIIEETRAIKVPDAAEVIDAKDCIVAPGFIDMHSHLREPGFEYKEDIESGTKAAASGGYTTICCMPNTNPVNDNATVTDFIFERRRLAGVIDVLPIGAISRGQKGENLADIGDMATAGAVAISDDGQPVMNSILMRRAMEYAKGFGIPVISHCEDKSLSPGGVMHESALSTKLGLRGIPSAVEEVMLARDIMLAELTGSRLHIAHLSSAGSVELVRAAKKKGILVTAEVTPHHLALTQDAVDGYDVNAKVNPPLRQDSDRCALIEGLCDGTIDAIATDHAPHAITDKEVGFQDSSFGIIGFETMLPIVLNLVHEKKITIERMIESLTICPAKILNLKDRGTLNIGSVADIVIFDPESVWTIHSKDFLSKARNTPFDGLRVRGKVMFTISKGKVVYSRGY